MQFSALVLFNTSKMMTSRQRQQNGSGEEEERKATGGVLEITKIQKNKL
jgi:hypothetical protein